MLELTMEVIQQFEEKKGELLDELFAKSGIPYLEFKEAGAWYSHVQGPKDTFKLNGIPKFCVWVDTAARGSTTICWIEYEEETE